MSNATAIDPEARGLVVMFIGRPERERFQNDDQQCQPHRELWEQIMEGNGEGEVQAVYCQSRIHVRF